MIEKTIMYATVDYPGRGPAKSVERGNIMPLAGQATVTDGLAAIVEPERIRLQLEKILANPEFLASKRNHEFLRYVVEETLAGRAHFIKGYNIAQSVFNRDASFDPQLDPVVRIEASRLRRCLERYYLTAGREDPIRIEIPKGTYVPIFNCGVETPRPPNRELTLVPSDIDRSALVADPSLPSVIVLPFRDLGTGQEFLAAGMTEELISALTQFNMLRVIGVGTSFGLAPVREPSELGQELCVDYVVHGTVRIEAARIRITCRLLRVADGAYVWSKSFDRQFQAGSVIEMETDIARTIASTLGAPYGTIARFSALQFRRGVPPDLAAYQCVLRWYHMRRTPSRSRNDEFRREVEQAIRLAPHYSELRAVLAYLLLDAFKQSPTRLRNPSPPLDEALAAARSAVSFDAESAFARLALSAVHFYRHDLGRASEEAAKALELNPCNPEVMFQVGWRTAVSEDWERGMNLVLTGRQLDPDSPKWCRLALALECFGRGDGRAALIEIDNGAIISIPLGYVIGAAVLAEFGELDRAAAVVAEGNREFPGLFEEPEAEFAVHNFAPGITGRLLASLNRLGIRRATTPGGR
jgi:adenylate cyclase